MRYDVVVVGCGFAGSIMARRYAEEADKRVLIVEKHNHVGGHAHDRYNSDGILIHQYGPHIFHTNDVNVWSWISRFTEWNYYQHRVLSYVDGKLVPMPITNKTINAIFDLNLSVQDLGAWLEKNRIPVKEIRNSKDVILDSAGNAIYEKLFKNYTYKQWGRYPDELSPDVVKRVPIRYSVDDRYFSDKYQGLPKGGYTAMFNNILDHKNISVLLNTNWFDIRDGLEYKQLVYTGPIDSFFSQKFGPLEYRSVNFKYETILGQGLYQSVGTINYPNDYDFTRITEYRHFTGQMSDRTTIAREFSSESGEPFYPVKTEGNALLAEKYLKAAQAVKNTTFIGRLAEYAYYNMDQITKRALECVL